MTDRRSDADRSSPEDGRITLLVPFLSALAISHLSSLDALAPFLGIRPRSSSSGPAACPKGGMESSRRREMVASQVSRVVHYFHNAPR